MVVIFTLLFQRGFDNFFGRVYVGRRPFSVHLNEHVRIRTEIGTRFESCVGPSKRSTYLIGGILEEVNYVFRFLVVHSTVG